MALTKSQREAKWAEGARLVRTGKYSRREIQAIIKEKYGETYHERMYSQAYQSWRPSPKQVAPEPRPEPRPQRTADSTSLYPRPRKSRHYQTRFMWSLRVDGFIGKEAREFAEYWRKYSPPGGGRKQMVPVVLTMMDDRRAFKQAFLLEARSKGWGAEKANKVYESRIIAIYKDLEKKKSRGGMMGKFLHSPFVWKDVHGRPYLDRKGRPEKRINPWALKEATFMTLAPEDQWETPRSHWVTPQTEWKRSPAVRQFAKKELNRQKKWREGEIKRTGDPTGEHDWALSGIKFQLKEGLY